MLTGRSSLQCSTVNPKGPFPLGPFPRHIWIHHNTPQDSLDKACHEIWKRVQGLPEELQPRSSSPLLQLSCHPVTSSEALREDSSSTTSSSQKESLENSICKDEISMLVEQEYLSLTQENATELEMQRSEDEKATPAASCQAPANNHLTMPSDGDQMLDERDAMENVYRALTGNKREVKLRSICDVQLSTKSTVTGILLPAKLIYKNAKSTESGNSNMMGSNTQIAKLLAQFPLKRVEATKTLDTKTVTEETKFIKDLLLQNNVFGSAAHKDNVTRPSPIMAVMESQGSVQKKQLPVFAKICSKTDPELVADGLCQNNATSTAIDKNNLKYSGNVFTPRFPTNSTATSLKQPMWLSLNYPPPPVFPNHSSFPQYQSLYQQRARIPYQQTLHPQLGCYSRQVTPYNPQQIFRSPYTPVLSYIPLVQPGYSYQQRNPTKPSSSVRDPPAMAGDGPQYPFSPSYGFTSTTAGPVRTNPYFSSNGGGNSF
ncbi:uncharacterized protein C1orf94 homolog isoform X1 [Podarcis raffonei]|uniref:uncharacterized protein C1orf94 homolog isoform X1 n=2 Tax=Podarcis raffonei TaxID=65483 RepID=UPI0023299451|nr:uncharacterized protein C1orf94 homolog isoform X1 [Podarcis raffonei]